MQTMPQSEQMVKELVTLMQASRAGFSQERVYLRGMLLVLAELLTFGTHHLTDLLRSVGLTEEDWTAWYRLLQTPGRFDEAILGAMLVAQTRQQVAGGDPYVVGIDSTGVPRTSHRIEGSHWQKCPRNPPWKVGIHRAQRFLNLSWLAPLEQGYSRAVPLRWLPAFPPKAKSQCYPVQLEQQAGITALTWLRPQLPSATPLVCLADGSYDKPDFWKQLPLNTVALVRTAKNRVLKGLPPPYCGRGRRRKYGVRAPAPQAYLQDRQGWQTVSVKVRGRQRRMVTRVEGPFLREAMPDLPLLLIVVRGQQWQKAGHGKRRAACYYLVNAVLRAGQWPLPMPLDRLLAWAWQRWELEVVHREVKSGLGLGDKQCFQRRAAVTSVQWSAWVYSLLTLSAYRCHGAAAHVSRSAAWQRHPRRCTLQTALDACRRELTTQPDFSWLCAASRRNWQNIEPHVQRLTSKRLPNAFFLAT